MNRAIIVSLSKDTAEIIEQTVRSSGFGYVGVITGGSELRRIIKSETAPDLIVIAAPLADEFGHELARDVSEETSAGVIFICGGDIAADMSDRLYDHGIEVLPMPVSRELLADSITNVTPEASELKESSDVLSRIDDIRLINKAKSVLMKYLHFTEPQAHRHIEKQAMNNRCTRREAAEHIIDTYK